MYMQRLVKWLIIRRFSRHLTDLTDMLNTDFELLLFSKIYATENILYHSSDWLYNTMKSSIEYNLYIFVLYSYLMLCIIFYITDMC